MDKYIQVRKRARELGESETREEVSTKREQPRIEDMENPKKSCQAKVYHRHLPVIYLLLGMFFSIQADESNSVRKTEQLSLIIRFYIEIPQKTVHEFFASFVSMGQLYADAMAADNINSLERKDLDYNLLLLEWVLIEHE